MSFDPLISVIIPAYNGAAWIRESVGSVLEQTYSNLEIIVVDNGSSDNTLDILAGYGNKIIVAREIEKGIGSARNKGLETATGEFFAFLDQDDIWFPQKLKLQMELMLSSSAPDVVYSDAEEFTGDRIVHSSFYALFPLLRSPGCIGAMLVRSIVPLMSTSLVRRRLVQKHSISFSRVASGVDDLGFLFEIAYRGGTFAAVPQILVRRRLHETNLSKDHFNRYSKRIALYEELLDRLGTTSEMSDHLIWGLRQAHFKIGEWHWGRHEHSQARFHLRNSLGPDTQGMRSTVYFVGTMLPTGFATFLKRIWRSRRNPR